MNKRLILMLATAALCTNSIPGWAQSTGYGSWFRIFSNRNTSMARAVNLAHYLYSRGVAPQPVAFADNVDCRGGVDLIDVIYLVNYVLRGGPAPCDWTGWYRDPSDTRDAETAAMWESGEITAPPVLLDRVQRDLWRLRSWPGAEQTAMASLRFFPRWMASRVSLMIDSDTYAAIQHGSYQEWDSLNTLCGAREFEYYWFDPSGPYFVEVYFNGIKNSVLLARMYSAVPGILSAQEEYYVWSGGFPNPDIVYPLLGGDTNTYLFQMSWNLWTGLRQRFWYGVALPDTAWIVGDWDPKLEPRPAWWEQADANIERYWAE